MIRNPNPLKNLVVISAYTLLISWMNLGWAPKSGKLFNDHGNDSSQLVKDPSTNEITELYDRLDLHEKGLSKQAFEYACKGYKKLLAKKKIQEGYLTICDMSQSSRQKRLYLLDMVHNEIELNTYVAHGRNSGAEYATHFSNRPESLQSSLGFYITRNTYNGEHGLSLRIEGVEPGYNDKALQRAIVVHGAEYMEEGWLNKSAYMGRSYGCPAVPTNQSALIISKMKNGNCLFIYYPSKKYLKDSKILNG